MLAVAGVTLDFYGTLFDDNDGEGRTSGGAVLTRLIDRGHLQISAEEARPVWRAAWSATLEEGFLPWERAWPRCLELAFATLGIRTGRISSSRSSDRLTFTAAVGAGPTRWLSFAA